MKYKVVKYNPASGVWTVTSPYVYTKLDDAIEYAKVRGLNYKAIHQSFEELLLDFPPPKEYIDVMEAIADEANG